MNPEAPEHHRILYVSLGVVMCVSAVFVWAYMTFPEIRARIPFIPDTSASKDLVPNVPLKEDTREITFGTAYLTLAKAGSSTPLTLYELDLSSGELSKQKERASNKVYVPHSDTFAYVNFATKKAVLTLVKDRQEIPVFASVSKRMVRNPNFSRDGNLVVFGMSATSSKNIEKPSSWEVHMGHVSSRESTYIGRGFLPTFVPGTDEIVYLKDDGLYAYHSLGGEHKAWTQGSSKNYHYSQTFAFDPSGTQFVWAVPLFSKLYVFEVTGKMPLKLSLKRSWDIVAYFPKFTSDGHFLIAYTRDDPSSFKGSRIVQISIEKGTLREIASLSETDWKLGQLVLSDVR